MNEKFLISTIGIFILYNLLTVVVASVMYFFTKEIYRVKKNNPSTFIRNIIGSVIGIFIMLNMLFVNFALDASFTPISTSGWGWFKPVTFVPITLISPSIIYLLVFPVLIDRKLILPIFIFTLIGQMIMVPWTSVEVFAEPLYWSTLLLIILSLTLISLFIFFFEFNNLFKNNGIKLTLYFVIWIAITLLFKITQVIIISTILSMSMGQFVTYAFTTWAIEAGYLTILFLFFGSIIFFIEKVYANFSKLETFTTKDDVSYYKMSLAQSKLKNIIDTQKINIGILLLIDISASDNDDRGQVLLDIKSRVEWDYKGSFFFKATSHYYGIFIPIENQDIDIAALVSNNKQKSRDKKDFLFKFDRTLESIKAKHVVPISASASIYGVHSYDVTELIEYSRFLLTPVVRRTNINNIIVYDFNRVKTRLEERGKVMSMPIDINTLNISYLRGINKEAIYYPSISYKLEGVNSDFNKLPDANLTKEIKEYIVRYTSYQALRRFEEKSTLVIYYPTHYISSDSFNINEFSKKINRHLDSKNVIIGLILNGEKSKKNFKATLKTLRAKGFRFAIIHSDLITQEKVDSIKPEFILDIEDISNPLKITEKKITYKTDADILNGNLVL